MSKQKFHVVVARPVVLSTVVTIEAGSEAEALQLAEEQASRLPEAAWRVESEEDDYAVDPLVAVPDEELEDEDIAGSVMQDVRYLLLRGNTNAGEGCLVPQPWLSRRGATMQSDMLEDWLAELQELADSRTSFDDCVERAAHKATGGRDH